MQQLYLILHIKEHHQQLYAVLKKKDFLFKDDAQFF